MKLRFPDPLEEQEYLVMRTPLLKQFFNYLFVAITGILIAYTVRYFIKELFPQNYIIVALIVAAAILFIITHKVGKCFDFFLLAYICMIIALFTTVFKRLLDSDDNRESFYMGYAFAMIHRLIGYGVIEFTSMIVLYIVSVALRFSLISNPDILLTIIVCVLDALTVYLSYKSERMERGLFDASYRAKKDVLKFKNILTQYLPNQMAIFNNEYTETLYVNNAFKRTFKCKDSTHTKEVLEKFLIETETIEKHKGLFNNLGVKSEEDQQKMTLSRFMDLLAQNADLLGEIGTLTFPVIEDEVVVLPPRETRENIIEVHDLTKKSETIVIKKERDHSKSHSSGRTRRHRRREEDGKTINLNDSVGSSDRGSSFTGFSDLGYEEGRKRVFKVKIFPLFWDETEAIAMVMDDITQQKIIMELKVADKNKDLVIAMVSHELRTPLNGILGMLDIAKKNIQNLGTISYLDACKNSGILMLNLVNSILDMQQIKDNKLKLIYSQVHIPGLFNELRSLFDHCCQIKNLYLDFEIAPNTPKLFATDKNRLSQILINLLGNAVKFTFSGGIKVSVEPEEGSSNKIRFSVRDTGIGISKEDQERLFKLYGKLEQKDKKINTQGVGLGLTISNTLALLLNPNGHAPIQIESELGRGTCFSFSVESHDLSPSGKNKVESLTIDEISYRMLSEGKERTLPDKIGAYSSLVKNDNFSKIIGLPTSICHVTEDNKETYRYRYTSLASNLDEKPTVRKEVKRILDKVPSESEEVMLLSNPPMSTLVLNRGEQQIIAEKRQEEDPWCLIVDDNPFNLMVASHIMQEKGFRVVSALNGQEAIEKAKIHERNNLSFELALMDCQMPVMDGYEATLILKKMMEEGALHEYPIVALTANNRNEIHDKLCKEVGMDGHVAKPLQIGELEEVLKEVNKKRSKS